MRSLYFVSNSFRSKPSGIYAGRFRRSDLSDAYDLIEGQGADALEAQRGIKVDSPRVRGADVQPGIQGAVSMALHEMADDIGREPFATMRRMGADSIQFPT